MKLRLDAPSKAPFWFVGDPAVNVRDFAEAMNLVVRLQRNQQPVPGAGQDSSDFYDRGNQRLAFEASTAKICGTVIERMDEFAKLAALAPGDQPHAWAGDVWARVETAGEFAEYRLPEALISLAGVEFEGAVGLRLRYLVQAGGIDYSGKVTGTKGVAITADFAAPAEVSLGAFAESWTTGNVVGDTFQIQFSSTALPGVEFYLFEVDDGGGVAPGVVAISAGNNLAEIAAWLNANTLLEAIVDGGDILIRTPAVEGDEIYLTVDLVTAAVSHIDYGGPVVIEEGAVLDEESLRLTADLTA